MEVTLRTQIIEYWHRNSCSDRVQKPVETFEEYMQHINDVADECGYGRTPAT